MKVIGPMTDAMAKAMSTFPMAILTRASTGRAKYGAKGSTYGKAESSTRASGLKGTRRATESGRESLVTTTSVSGEQTSHTGLESILGATRTSMKVNGKPTKLKAPLLSLRHTLKMPLFSITQLSTREST